MPPRLEQIILHILWTDMYEALCCTEASWSSSRVANINRINFQRHHTSETLPDLAFNLESRRQ
jgi:hypothetical protein